MYTVCSILKCSFEEFVKVSILFIVAVAIFLSVLAEIPKSVLLLPDSLM